MKPRTVSTVSCKTPMEICSVLHTVTVYKMGEEWVTSHVMIGVRSSAINAMTYATDAAVDSAKKPSGKCTVSPTKEQFNGGSRKAT